MRVLKSSAMRVFIFLVFALCLSGAILSPNIKMEGQCAPSADVQAVSLSTDTLLAEVPSYTCVEKDGGFSVLGLEEVYSDMLTLLHTLPEGARVCFDGITVPSLNIDMSLILTGTLTISEGNLVIASGNIILDGLSLTLDAGSVKIKNAALSCLSGEIYAKGAAAIIGDYSAESRLNVRGGIIRSESTYAILSTMGSVSITGGEVISLGSSAIYNSSTLSLGLSPRILGFEYDIESEHPIHLSAEGAELSSEIKVKLNREFVRGNKTIAFLDATAVQADMLRLFDISGEEYKTQYFDASSATDEENFLAVYLPFVARFYVDMQEYHTLEFLLGEYITAPKEPEALGYNFGGWYTDYTFSKQYDFTKEERSDISLFASFSLAPPSFSISSLTFTFDRALHMLAFDSLTHPLASEGSFSYEWYKNGEAININSASVPLRYVFDSGSYKCKVSFAYNGDFVTIETPDTQVKIHKCIVDIPDISKVKYNGNRQNTSLSDTPEYTVLSEGGINVGVYDVILTLTDADNFMFSDSEQKEITLEFVIERAENSFTLYPIAENCFAGQTPKLTYKALFGEAVIYYSNSPLSNWSLECPSEAGEYYLLVSIPATENYTALSSSAIEFSLIKEYCTGIGLELPPDKTEYVAFEKIDLSGAIVVAGYNSGRSERLPLSALGVEYKNGEWLLVSDKSVVIKYLEHTLPLGVSVSPAEYDLSSLEFSDGSVIYSGYRHTLTASADIVGLDGIELKYTLRGGGTNVGAYSVTLSFESSSINYRLPEDISRTLTVLPLALNAVYSGTSCIYDGTPKLPSGYIESVSGAKIALTVTGSASYAGNYVAVASSPNPNYTLLNPNVEFEIKKAVYDLSGITWSVSEFVYSGEAMSVSLSGLPAGVSVIGYLDATATNVGKYSAEATLLYDTENYEPLPPLRHSWQILPADYDMSTIVFLDSTFTFDLEYHTPAVNGVLPVGADGSSPSYSFSAEFRDVTDGAVTVHITFKSESKNYNTPAPISVTLEILPQPVNIEWGTLSFVYNGGRLIPEASCAVCDIAVDGGAVDSGAYIAVCRTLDKNYTPINPRVTFTIEKCKNAWSRQPGILGAFVGDSLMPYGTALFGEVLFEYFTKDGAPAVMPLAAGEYYMLAGVGESRNYLPLVSEPIYFDISPVLPVSLSFKLNQKSFSAFDIVGRDDISVYIVNNNGSLTSVDFAAVDIEYPNATSLRYGDSSIVIRVGELWERVPLAVQRAKYDMSEVKWINNIHVYNGEMKQAELTGLPGGVTVLEYIGNTATDAGSYSLSARLDYDEDNFYPPVLPSGKLVIEKCIIPYPSAESFFYDGRQKQCTVEDTAYYKGGTAYGTERGEYFVSLTLYDPENYTFSGSASYAALNILPRSITLRVARGGNGYYIESGSIIGKDKLEEKYYQKDGFIYLSVQNPNYSATVIPYEMGARGENMWLVLLIALIIILLILIASVIYFRRDSLSVLVSEMSTRFLKRPRPAPVLLPLAPVSRERTLLSVDEAYADTVISDTMARTLVQNETIKIETRGNKKFAVNIGAISAAFKDGDTVDINRLKERGLVPKDTLCIKVLGGGVIDKALTVYADSFSPSAIKMIALTGGKAQKCRTRRKK